MENLCDTIINEKIGTLFKGGGSMLEINVVWYIL